MYSMLHINTKSLQNAPRSYTYYKNKKKTSASRNYAHYKNKKKKHVLQGAIQIMRTQENFCSKEPNTLQEKENNCCKEPYTL